MLKKTIKYIFIFLAFIVVALYVFSPYKKYDGFSQKIIKTDVIINAPITKVFAYLSNSGNASKWSTYVHHITPLNKDSITDGQVGSTRRCFKQANEKGIIWDEKITERIENQSRKLIIYNAHGFPMFAEGLATQQLYTVIDSSKTKLSLTLYFNATNNTTWDIAKMYAASYVVDYIFKNNLKNIKKYNEQ